MNKKFYSFKQWCLDNSREDFLELWDYELNNFNPDDITSGSTKYCYFKCKRQLHKSRKVSLNNLTKTSSKTTSDTLCKECNSIGQFILDNYGEKFLKNIWSENNKFSPFEISKGSRQRILIKCLENNSHPDHEIFACNFRKTYGCPYCSGKSVCLTNSLGYLYPKSLSVWSDKNEKTPYEYTPFSKKDVWWKCENGKHEDYLRNISNSTTYNFCCHDCVNDSIDRKKDLKNQKFNLITVVELDEERTNNTGSTYWFCDCECGTKHKSILGSHLSSGAVQSCGCLWLNKISGENNYLWKGGITSDREKERGSFEYRQWAKNIYKKCFYTCQCCGKSNNIKKNAHHILNFSQHKESKYSVDNGILLCEECHSHVYPGSFHNTYGTLDNTPEQLEEYINMKRKQLGIDIPFSIEKYRSGEILKPVKLIKYKNAI